MVFFPRLNPFFGQTLVFALAASQLSWSGVSLLGRDGFSFLTSLLRIHSVNWEDALLQSSLIFVLFLFVQNVDPLGQKKVCSKHIQDQFLGQSRSVKQNKWNI